MSSIPGTSIDPTADTGAAGVDGQAAPTAKLEVKGTAATAAAHGSKKARLDGGWDPIHCPDWDKQTTAAFSTKRIQRDLQQLYKDPPQGIFAVPDEGDLSRIHLLIVGPMDTPYEGGFFYFLIRLPPDYPLRPPRARLMTTAGDS
uniref:Ubiquitin-conjugating enzyme E2 Z n=1 Tax=Plectus sambesii TaxID=2011161 RepID=A0A914VK83_9BILA